MQIRITSNHPCFDKSSLAVAYEFINDDKWSEQEECFYIDEYLENDESKRVNRFTVIELLEIDNQKVIKFDDGCGNYWWTTRFEVLMEKL